MADPYRFLGAICARVAATPELLEVLPGGAFVGLGDSTSLRPYASLTEVANSTHDWDTGGTFWVHSVIQADIHAEDAASAARAAWVWGRTFHPQAAPFVVQGCDVRRVWCAASHLQPVDTPALQASNDFVISVEVHAEMVQFAP